MYQTRVAKQMKGKLSQQQKNTPFGYALPARGSLLGQSRGLFTVSSILQMQRNIGNRAVTQLLQNMIGQQAAQPVAQCHQTYFTGSDYDDPRTYGERKKNADFGQSNYGWISVEWEQDQQKFSDSYVTFSLYGTAHTEERLLEWAKQKKEMLGQAAQNFKINDLYTERQPCHLTADKERRKRNQGNCENYLAHELGNQDASVYYTTKENMNRSEGDITHQELMKRQVKMAVTEWKEEAQNELINRCNQITQELKISENPKENSMMRHRDKGIMAINNIAAPIFNNQASNVRMQIRREKEKFLNEMEDDREAILVMLEDYM